MEGVGGSGMVPFAMRAAILGFFSGALIASAAAQSGSTPPARLTLADVVRLAKQRNGTIRSAFAEVEAAKARRTGAYAAFLPTVTPNFSYTYRDQEIADPVFGGRRFIFDQKLGSIDANWLLFDSGQRNTAYRRAKVSEEAQVQSATNQLRQTLFTVERQYFETLRAQEQLKVSEAQRTRTQAVLEQTKKRVEVGDAARREILQASADALNADVSLLTARNLVATQGATLKASIGLEVTNPLPPLEPVSDAPQFERPSDLNALWTQAISNRPDLMAARQQEESQRLNVLNFKTNAGVTYSLSGNYTLQVTPDQLSNRSLRLLVSYPLFDGGAARSDVRAAEATLESQRLQNLQLERNIRSEIESAYLQHSQNIERLEAAKAAVAAARENYAAALGAQQVGSGDLIEVLTAQVSLVTAENNFINALYDTLISDLSLRLATGQPLPGENTA